MFGGKIINKMPMNKPLIEYEEVTIYQDKALILQDVNLMLNQGQLVYLVGEVGSGKSTLLQTMFCETPINSGKASILGIDLNDISSKNQTSLRRKLGIVHQDFKLLSDQTVYGNLRLVLEATGWKDNTLIDDQIAEVLSRVGQAGSLEAFPDELSGGEQQRVALARALLNNPEVLLVDEPTGNLDFLTGKAIFKLLYDLALAGTLVIMATHNLQSVYDYNGTVYQIKNNTLHNITSKVYVG